MQTLRRANERGLVEMGWLNSKHSFSFGSYYDPEHMGFSVLRVLNDDYVEPGTGFGTHPHRDMEILSYIQSGTIEHRDTMGNVKQIHAGEFQIMSAGTGVAHSEYNASKQDPLKFLQIWLIPNQVGVKPAYDQKQFEAQAGLTPIVHPTAEGAMRAHTDGRVYRYQASEKTLFDADGDRVYVHVVSGEINVNGQQVGPGDALKIESGRVEFSATGEAEALVFDLP